MIDYIPYAILFIPMTYLFYSWNFVPVNHPHLFHQPHPFFSGNHQFVLYIYEFCFLSMTSGIMLVVSIILSNRQCVCSLNLHRNYTNKAYFFHLSFTKFYLVSDVGLCRSRPCIVKKKKK